MKALLASAATAERTHPRTHTHARTQRQQTALTQLATAPLLRSKHTLARTPQRTLGDSGFARVIGLSDLGGEADIVPMDAITNLGT